MDTSRRRTSSQDRRTSRRSTRSARASVTESIESDTSLLAAEQKLEKILQAEEHELIVYAIRDELIERALNECYQKYLERQAACFTAHCAYRALSQIVELGLFMHDPGQQYYTNHPTWTPDKPPEPSPYDSWASSTVPVKPKPIKRHAWAPSILSEAAKPSSFVSISPVEFKPHSEVDDDGRLLFQATQSTESVCFLLNKGSDLSASVGPTASACAEEEQGASVFPDAETISVFTRKTRVPKEDLSISMICNPAYYYDPVKKKVATAPEVEEYSLDQVSLTSNESATKLPALRTNVTYSKNSEPIVPPSEGKSKKTSNK